MNPFRRPGGTHEVQIVENVPQLYSAFGGQPCGNSVGTSSYAYKVVCSCQFEVLCQTMEAAEAWKRQHLGLHGVPVEGKVEAVGPTSA